MFREQQKASHNLKFTIEWILLWGKIMLKMEHSSIRDHCCCCWSPRSLGSGPLQQWGFISTHKKTLHLSIDSTLKRRALTTLVEARTHHLPFNVFQVPHFSSASVCTVTCNHLFISCIPCPILHFKRCPLEILSPALISNQQPQSSLQEFSIFL